MKPHYRAVFISDIHLGTAGCRAEELADFLRSFTCDWLYLVGDIVDLWALSRKSYFPESHIVVLRKFLSRSAQGVQVVYVPGNHDEAVRDMLPLRLGNIAVLNEAMHRTADGRSLLVIHGDQFDQVVKYARWLAFLGDMGYHALLRSNIIVNALRRRFGFGYWSLSGYVKNRVKAAVNFIGGYENAVVKAVLARGADGVVCGHIHHAEMKTMNGVLYCNTGDWVESMTALVEHPDGRLEIVRVG